MSAEFHQSRESQGEDRGEALSRSGQAPKGDGIWETGGGEAADASQDVDAETQGDAAGQGVTLVGSRGEIIGLDGPVSSFAMVFGAQI